MSSQITEEWKEEAIKKGMEAPRRGRWIVIAALALVAAAALLFAYARRGKQE
jgi:hypothetical protein